MEVIMEVITAVIIAVTSVTSDMITTTIVITDIVGVEAIHDTPEAPFHLQREYEAQPKPFLPAGPIPGETDEPASPIASFFDTDSVLLTVIWVL
ncbi:hypothetical protein N7481_009547 [Penicillium waksmanii]|uniref:uncharacterized protein n=1 Tax=Penicillium waksmanii TaxID=69791 RepID=UPI002546C443|nr:uncharacterized protein N7481_009547 [Penicillium waksmanii]KAJ5975840.1 hypothetical protein N7481_009547 [Penicillium waksmanii]